MASAIKMKIYNIANMLLPHMELLNRQIYMWVILSRHSGLPQIYNTNERNKIDHVSLFKKNQA